MDDLGFLLIVSGMLYLAYAMITRNRKSIYFTGVVINENKEREYLELQLNVSILNGILLIVSGVIALQTDLPVFYFTTVPLIIHLNNFVAKMWGYRKGYLEDI